MYPLAVRTVPHLRSRLAYMLGNYGHARSQGGRQPAAAKPRLNTCFTIQRYIRICTKCPFFLHAIQPLPAAGIFSRSRLRGTQGARVYTFAQAWAPAGLCGACSGLSTSRGAGSSPGIAFRRARAKQDDGNRTIQHLRCCCCCIMSLSHRPSISQSSLLCGSHGTTAAAHEALPFETATDGASVRVRVRVCNVSCLPMVGIRTNT